MAATDNVEFNVEYKIDSLHTQFTDSSYVLVNQTTGDDSTAWSQIPDDDGKYSSPFKTLAAAFKFCAKKGTNINIQLEIDTDNCKPGTTDEYFHVPLSGTLTITGCQIHLRSWLAKKSYRGDEEKVNKYCAVVVFDYPEKIVKDGKEKTMPAYFLRLYGTYVHIGDKLSSSQLKSCAGQSKVKVGLAKISGDTYLDAVDKARGKKSSCAFHGIGLYMTRGCKIFFKVNGSAHLATLFTDSRTENGKVVWTKKSEVLPCKGSNILKQIAVAGKTGIKTR